MKREQMVAKAAQALANVENGGNVEQSDRDVSAVILDAILPQITTVAELEALPSRALLVDVSGEEFRAQWPRALVALRSGPLTVVWQPEVTA